MLAAISTAAALALTTIAPSYAQTALSGSWLAGPDASGSSTIVGRIETVPSRAIRLGTSLQVTGWAADVSGGSIDGMEVWAGAKDKGGTKLATGSVGLARPDIAEALGSSFGKSGFNAVVPGTAWNSLAAGPQSIYVYLHTPNKGSWYRTFTANLPGKLALQFPDDPVVWVAKPLDGQNITQKQPNSKFTFSGVALDRNSLSSVQGAVPYLAPGVGQALSSGCSGCGGLYTQHKGAGVSSITAYIDNPPGRGDNSAFGNFGASCTSCIAGVAILVSNKGSLNAAGKPQGSIATRNYGDQFDYSGWVISINTMELTPGPHTLYVTATSAITGKQNTASASFNLLPYKANQKVQP